jgi:hypothetical protein
MIGPGWGLSGVGGVPGTIVGGLGFSLDADGTYRDSKESRASSRLELLQRPDSAFQFTVCTSTGDVLPLMLAVPL